MVEVPRSSPSKRACAEGVETYLNDLWMSHPVALELDMAQRPSRGDGQGLVCFTPGQAQAIRPGDSVMNH